MISVEDLFIILYVGVMKSLKEVEMFEQTINERFSLKAHQQSRKADRLLAAGKYEEAISCHKKAAGEQITAGLAIICGTYPECISEVIIGGVHSRSR